jgi:hypothetical protein
LISPRQHPSTSFHIIKHNFSSIIILPKIWPVMGSARRNISVPLKICITVLSLHVDISSVLASQPKVYNCKLLLILSSARKLCNYLSHETHFADVNILSFKIVVPLLCDVSYIWILLNH